MRQCRLLSFAVLALTVSAMTGCARTGHVMVDYTRGQEAPPLATAPLDGTYSLYPSNGTEPARAVKLRKGDPLGFRVREDGVPIAVARDRELPIEGRLAQSYYWKLEGSGRKGHWDGPPQGLPVGQPFDAATVASETIPPDADEKTHGDESAPERVGMVERAEPAVSTGEGADGGM